MGVPVGLIGILFCFIKIKKKIMAVHYMTKEGYNKLLEEVNYLESEKRPSISKQIAEARDKGDLSENAEYDAAKEAQGILEAKISQLKTLISGARLIDESQITTDSVQILNKVTIRNTKNNQKMVYTLVSESEADLKQGKIAINTPIGKGLLGKKIGEFADIQVPNGLVSFEIIDISL
jgi:transcription elongation factor GreA